MLLIITVENNLKASTVYTSLQKVVWRGKANDCTCVLAKTILYLVYGNNIIIIIILKQKTDASINLSLRQKFTISIISSS